MNYNKIFYTVMLSALSGIAWSMEELSEKDLAKSTGQDGVTIQLDFANGTIGYGQISYIDTDGLDHPTTPMNSAGSIVLAPKVNGEAVRLLHSDGTAAAKGVNIKIDADSNNNKPILNIHASLPDAQSINIMPFSLYLASGKESIFSGSTLRTGVTEILELGGQGAYVNLSSGTTAAVNIQLGNQSQNYLAKLSGSISCIAGNRDCSNPTAIPIKLKDASTSQNIQLGLMLKATNTNFALDPFHLNVSSEGVVFGATGATDKLNIELSNIAIGGITSSPSTLPLIGPASSTLFNSVPNGALGSFGAIGVTTSNLEVKVRGI